MSVCSDSEVNAIDISKQFLSETDVLIKKVSVDSQHHCKSTDVEVEDVNSLQSTFQPINKDSGDGDIDGGGGNNEDSEYEYDDEPPVERWAPLGATGSPELEHASVDDDEEQTEFVNVATVHQLEAEQEQLNGSLMALTSHFAQVQFRLKQIVSAPAEEKDQLLRQLEEFAFRGIPDMRLMVASANGMGMNGDVGEMASDENDDGDANGGDMEQHQLRVALQREKQLQLIEQLKRQLEDLETFAYEVSFLNTWKSNHWSFRFFELLYHVTCPQNV